MDASKWIGSRDNETLMLVQWFWYLRRLSNVGEESFGSIWSRRRRDTAGLGLWMLKPFLLRKTHYSGRWIFWQSKRYFQRVNRPLFYGYEIHSGITNFDDGKSLTLMKPIHEAGEISPEGSQNVSDTMNVYGTYVHEYLMVKVLLNLWWKLYLLKGYEARRY